MKRILVADSGMGGLSILSVAIRRGIRAQLDYVAMPSLLPFGSLSPAALSEVGRSLAEQARTGGYDGLLLACNTLTAACIDTLREEYSFPIIGTEPSVAPAASRIREGHILVAVTPTTAESPRFKALITAQNRGNLLVYPCPTLAADIERLYFAPDRLRLTLRDTLGLFRGSVKGVVLGCTHYALIKPMLRRFFGKGVLLFDGANGVTDTLCSRLSLSHTEGFATPYTLSAEGNEEKYQRVLSSLLCTYA